MKNPQKVIGIFFLLFSILILFILPSIIYPKIYDDGIETTQYLLEMVLNSLRYIIICIFSFILGIKMIFKK